MKDFYFFFDRAGLPIAVFLTEKASQAVSLFKRLYRRSWRESYELGIRVVKESDVPAERWDEIHRIKIGPMTPPKPQIKLKECRRLEPTGLQSARYLSRR